MVLSSWSLNKHSGCSHISSIGSLGWLRAPVFKVQKFSSWWAVRTGLQGIKGEALQPKTLNCSDWLIWGIVGRHFQSFLAATIGEQAGLNTLPERLLNDTHHKTQDNSVQGNTTWSPRPKTSQALHWKSIHHLCNCLPTHALGGHRYSIKPQSARCWALPTLTFQRHSTLQKDGPAEPLALLDRNCTLSFIRCSDHQQAGAGEPGRAAGLWPS